MVYKYIKSRAGLLMNSYIYLALAFDLISACDIISVFDLVATSL